MLTLGEIGLKHARAPRNERTRSISNWPIVVSVGLSCELNIPCMAYVAVWERCHTAVAVAARMQTLFRVRHIKIIAISCTLLDTSPFALALALVRADSSVGSVALLVFQSRILFVWHAAKAASDLNRMKNAKYFSRVWFLVSLAMLLLLLPPSQPPLAFSFVFAFCLLHAVFLFVRKFYTTWIAIFSSQPTPSSSSTASCSKIGFALEKCVRVLFLLETQTHPAQLVQD